MFLPFFKYFFHSCKEKHQRATMDSLNPTGLVILLSFFFFFLFIFANDYSKTISRSKNDLQLSSFTPGTSFDGQNQSSSSPVDVCSGRYIYVYDLPSRFNDDVLKNCSSLIKYFDLCPYVTNTGLGPQVWNDPRGVLSNQSWFATNQFFLGVIFRARMKNYDCLTSNSSLASAVFVPFYAGLEIGRHLFGDNVTMRDTLAIDLVKWLENQQEWKRMWGRDHFFVSGRISNDFHRPSENDSDWGSKLMSLPASMNMTMLSIESTSWSNEVAIPYPTHFHPTTEAEVLEWQNRMRRHNKRYLFSFVGAPRPKMEDSVRGEIINQCLASRNACKFLDCSSGHDRCEDPVQVMKVFQDSVFCLQPAGDSYTRRSIFDSILAGCIPVFFHPFSAYAQYIWYFPKDYWTYSVYIPAELLKKGYVSLNKVFHLVPEEDMLAMREEVIRLIPKVIYADPRSKSVNFEDAFDIAVKGILNRIGEVRSKIEEGKDPSDGFAEGNSWEKRLAGVGAEDEWSTIFH